MKKGHGILSVTFSIPQPTDAATVFVANTWLPIPSTSRAVKVMGRVLSNCPLDECDVAVCTTRCFFDWHFFYVSSAGVFQSEYNMNNPQVKPVAFISKPCPYLTPASF
jgi:hypothetical protein